MVPSPALTASDDTTAATPSEAPPAPRWPLRLAAALPAVVLVAVCIWEIAVIVRAGDDVGSDADWDRAAAAVRADHEPGDLITFAPRWIDPTGRLHLGDLISLDMAGRMDGARYGRIWELSIRGAHAPETRGLEPAWTGHFGPVTVRRFEHEPARVLSDFVSLLGTASRSGVVARVFEEVGFEPHQCVRLTPVESRGGMRPAKAVYRKVRLGQTLVGYVGISDVFTRRDFRSPGRLRVLIGDKQVLTKRVGVRDGWMRFEIATTPTAAATVTFVADILGDKPGRRQVCFVAEARE